MVILASSWTPLVLLFSAISLGEDTCKPEDCDDWHNECKDDSQARIALKTT
jgi:hypothetical protein